MRISIVMVCLNSVRTIERTIISVISQDYDDVEYIVIDGGSTDGTVDIIKKYEQYISCWISEKDDGIYDAMNKGIDRATGDVIAFLNSDDWYEENIFGEIARRYEDLELQVLCGDIYFHRNNGVVRSHISKDDIEQEIRYCMGYHHSAMFVRKHLFNQFGKFDTQYRIVADYDWLLRVYDGHVYIAAADRVFTNFSYGGISSRYEMQNRHLQERKNASLSALDKNTELKEDEKQKWREKIETKCIEDGYSYKFAMILDAISTDTNKQMLANVKKAFTRDRYAVFGCGVCFRELKKILGKADVKIVQLWDNDRNKWGTVIDGIVVGKPEEMSLDQDMVIIASTVYEKEIETQLMDKGFQKNQHYLPYSEVIKKIVDAVDAGYGI